ncbi:MAG: PAS domain S-box protein [Hyphomicrobiaceae bacterium]|jgi:PAS domain S-box
MAYTPVMENGQVAVSRESGRQPRSVRSYLALFCAAVVTPILIFTVIVLHRYGTIGHIQLEQRVLATVRHLTSNVDRELGSVILALEALAASPSIEAGEYQRFRTHAARLVELRFGKYIRLSDANGQGLLDTRVETGEALPVMPKDAIPVAEVLRTKRPFVSNLLPSGNSFTITVPVLSEGEVSHLLTLVLDPAFILRAIDADNLPEGWNVGIVDAYERIIVAQSRGYQSDPGVIKRPSRDGIVAAEWLAPSGFFQAELTAAVRSTVADWSIRASVSPAVASAQTLSWGTVAAGGSIFVALSLLLGIYFGRQVTNPIRMTALAAAAFGRGEAVPQFALRLREVDEVLNALRTASAQRRLAEDQLRSAHERMTLILSATQMGMWEQDLSTDRVIWSEAMYQLYGRSPDEFTGDPEEVLSFVHPHDRQAFRQAYLDAVTGQADTFEQEFRIIRPTGEIRWLYRRAFVRRDAEGRAISVLGVAIDITERKEAEIANAKFAAIVASSSEAILSVSPDGTISTWNRGAELMFGFTSEQAVGMPLKALFGDAGESGYETIKWAISAGETLRTESICRRRDGHELEVAIVANPVRGSSEFIAGYSITIRDISARKEHDRHLANVLRELTHRSKNLLAIVQAMARQTALRSDNLADFQRRFCGRLQSLSRSHELLISNDWEGASLSDLIAVQRSVFGTSEGRIRATGPDVFLRPEAIFNIGLALHELVSNAERHGALSVDTGRVDLSWSIERGSDGSPRLVIVWRERGGQSAGNLLHRGFGRDILEHVTPTALGADVELKAVPDGLLWTLEVPSIQFARARLLSASA